jgi:hypothetical protein
MLPGQPQQENNNQMAKQNNITIRLGAAHWDAKVNTGEAQPIHFDIRAMDGSQRGEFFYELRKAISGQKPRRRNKRTR